MFKKGVVPSQGLRIIIVGCGKVGRTLVEQLGKEGHDITIVDKNRERISQVSNIYDVMGIAGNGASYKILQEAGIDDADLIIAVTGSDELNLLCCTIATQVGNCAAIARVRTPEYSQEAKYLRDKLGLALIINPELEAAIEMAHILHLPSSLEVTNFAHGQAQLIKYEIPEGSILDGTKLMDLGTRHHANILIGAVERDDEVTIPSGDFVLRKGNVINSLDLGSVISPKYITSEAIIAYVRAKKNSMNCNIETLYHMYDSRVEAIEFFVSESSNVTDIPLRDLKLKKHLLICFINRNGKIIIPTGNDCIQKNDTVMIITTNTGFTNLQDIME